MRTSKKKKWGRRLSASLLLSLSLCTTILAATPWVTASVTNVPGGGGKRTDWNHPSTKKTVTVEGLYASGQTNNLLNGTVYMVNGYAKKVSEGKSILPIYQKDRLIVISVGKNYYATFKTNVVEPSNAGDYSIKFSADNIN